LTREHVESKFSRHSDTLQVGRTTDSERSENENAFRNPAQSPQGRRFDRKENEH